MAGSTCLVCDTKLTTQHNISKNQTDMLCNCLGFPIEGQKVFFKIPFCFKCKTLVKELDLLHEKLERIQTKIQNKVYNITSAILNSENSSEDEESDSISETGKFCQRIRTTVCNNYRPKVLLPDINLDSDEVIPRKGKEDEELFKEIPSFTFNNDQSIIKPMQWLASKSVKRRKIEDSNLDIISCVSREPLPSLPPSPLSSLFKDLSPSPATSLTMSQLAKMSKLPPAVPSKIITKTTTTPVVPSTSFKNIPTVFTPVREPGNPPSLPRVNPPPSLPSLPQFVESQFSNVFLKRTEEAESLPPLPVPQRNYVSVVDNKTHQNDTFIKPVTRYVDILPKPPPGTKVIVVKSATTTTTSTSNDSVQNKENDNNPSVTGDKYDKNERTEIDDQILPSYSPPHSPLGELDTHTQQEEQENISAGKEKESVLTSSSSSSLKLKSKVGQKPRRTIIRFKNISHNLSAGTSTSLPSTSQNITGPNSMLSKMQPKGKLIMQEAVKRLLETQSTKNIQPILCPAQPITSSSEVSYVGGKRVVSRPRPRIIPRRKITGKAPRKRIKKIFPLLPTTTENPSPETTTPKRVVRVSFSRKQNLVLPKDNLFALKKVGPEETEPTEKFITKPVVKDGRLLVPSLILEQIMPVNNLPPSHFEEYGPFKKVEEGKFILDDKWTFIQHDNGFKCLNCEKFCPTRASLLAHMYRYRRFARLGIPEVPEEKEKRSFKPVEQPDGSFTVNVKWKFSPVDDGFKCGHCDKVRATQPRITKHIKAAHIDVGKIMIPRKSKLVSQRDDGSFVYKTIDDEGTEHFWPFTQDDKGFKCSTCGYQNISYPVLSGHFKRTHAKNGIPLTRNPRVNVELGDGKYIYADKWPYHYVSNETYECDTCGKQRKQRGALVEHIKCVHEGITNIMCDVCGKMFVHQNSYQVHNQSHLNKRNYLCSVCGEGFNNKGLLNSHQLRHLHKRKCDICDKEVSQVYFKAHRRAHINPGPKAECRLCEKEFKNASSLRKHSKKHNKFTDFLCKFCSLSFLQKSQLDMHLKIVHNVKKSKKNVNSKYLHEEDEDEEEDDEDDEEEEMEIEYDNDDDDEDSYTDRLNEDQIAVAALVTIEENSKKNKRR